MSDPSPRSPSVASLALKALPFALLGAGALLGLNLLVSRLFEERKGGDAKEAASAGVSGGVPSREKGAPPPDLGPAPSFALVSDEGKEVTSESLRGSPWIGDFIFIRCEGQCPLMTAKMLALTKEIPAGTGIRFVSFDVDPARDTVPAMAAYLREVGADPLRWRFLRGDEPAIRAVAIDGFRLAVADGVPGTPEPILHSNRFVLVDAAGRWRGVYDSESAEAMKSLREDALLLAATPARTVPTVTTVPTVPTAPKK